MTARKPTPILLQQLASRRQHLAKALAEVEAAIASVRKARPASPALAARLEKLRAQLERYAADEDARAE